MTGVQWARLTQYGPTSGYSLSLRVEGESVQPCDGFLEISQPLSHRSVSGAGCRFVRLRDGDLYCSQCVEVMSKIDFWLSIVRDMWIALGCLLMARPVSVSLELKFRCRSQPARPAAQAAPALSTEPESMRLSDQLYQSLSELCREMPNPNRRSHKTGLV